MIWKERFVFISRDVVFFEDQFPFAQPLLSDSQPLNEDDDVLWAPLSMSPLAAVEDKPIQPLGPSTLLSPPHSHASSSSIETSNINSSSSSPPSPTSNLSIASSTPQPESPPPLISAS